MNYTVDDVYLVRTGHYPGGHITFQLHGRNFRARTKTIFAPFSYNSAMVLRSKRMSIKGDPLSNSLFKSIYHFLFIPRGEIVYDLFYDNREPSVYVHSGILLPPLVRFVDPFKMGKHCLDLLQKLSNEKAGGKVDFSQLLPLVEPDFNWSTLGSHSNFLELTRPIEDQIAAYLTSSHFYGRFGFYPSNPKIGLIHPDRETELRISFAGELLDQLFGAYKALKILFEYEEYARRDGRNYKKLSEISEAEERNFNNSFAFLRDEISKNLKEFNPEFIEETYS